MLAGTTDQIGKKPVLDHSFSPDGLAQNPKVSVVTDSPLTVGVAVAAAWGGSAEGTLSRTKFHRHDISYVPLRQ